ncbi:arf-GAP with Rho-GAP domain, ANK repeat and PH domain-containing protein 1-like [Leucoraja erinacea]|uniref:arf-GAP with Rho-GAP domain, ANK repeat and PH domain-containing protein 1-like n=1 Tax=Leucoraja erinaceus TaxID=7782 RepID=UPI002458C050|nr:arf-GAP with Rho-GAP domain, ANK repeat and PH domain-containing protein 1-like [Leucoraja erinacea]
MCTNTQGTADTKVPCGVAGEDRGPWCEAGGPVAAAMEGGSDSVREWLRLLHLEQYAQHFADHRYHLLSDCRAMRSEDLSRIGIYLPGHRKRILSALTKGSLGLDPAPEPAWGLVTAPEQALDLAPQSQPARGLVSGPQPALGLVPQSQPALGHVPGHKPALGLVLNPEPVFSPVSHYETALGLVPGPEPEFGLGPDPERALGLVPGALGMFPSPQPGPGLVPHPRPSLGLVPHPEPAAPRSRPSLPATMQKPVPKKRSIYLYGPGLDPDAPDLKPLPPVPPRQGLVKPAGMLPPVARARELPVNSPGTTPRDLPVLPPRQSVDGRRRPPPLPTRPLGKDQASAYFTDSRTAPGVCLEDPKAGTLTPLLLQTQAAVPQQSQSGPLLPPRRPLDWQTQDSDPLEGVGCEQRPPDDNLMDRAEMNDKDSADPSPCLEWGGAGESPSSLFSDEDTADDYETMLNLPHEGFSFAEPGPAAELEESAGSSQSVRPHPLPGQGLDTNPLCPLIKAGWLDKNPPQGSYIYQRRFVRLDTDYLRYFENEKVSESIPSSLPVTIYNTHQCFGRRDSK